MGTYGSNTLRIKFANKGLADIFQLDWDIASKKTEHYAIVERENENTFLITEEEQEKVAWAGDDAWETFYNFVEVDMPLSKEIIKKSEVEYWSCSEEFFWDYVDYDTLIKNCPEKIQKWLEEDEDNKDYVYRWREESYGEFWYDDNGVEKDIELYNYCTHYNKDNIPVQVEEPQMTPVWYSHLANNLTEYLEEYGDED